MYYFYLDTVRFLIVLKYISKMPIIDPNVKIGILKLGIDVWKKATDMDADLVLFALSVAIAVILWGPIV